MLEKLLSKLGKIPHDKALHALGGIIIYSTLIMFIPNLIALIVVLVIATLKEVYDYYNPDKHTADLNDIIATILIPTYLELIQELLNRFQ